MSSTIKGVRADVWKTTIKICEEARARGGSTALLSFSAGKDAVGCWLAMREVFERVIPMYWFFVPDLEFVEVALRYYEDFFQTPIIRLPNKRRYLLMYESAFQPPGRYGVIERLVEPVRRTERFDQANAVRAAYGIPKAYHAIGNKATDSVTRRTAYLKQGAFMLREQVFYPIIEWNLNDLEGAFDYSGVKLAPEYVFYGRSFDGIMYRYLKPIREHYPKDYERIVDDFPLVELEFFRREHSRVAGHKPVYGFTK